MTGIKYSVTGEYKSHKPQRIKELTDKLWKGMEKACFIVENQAKQNVNKSGSQHPQVRSGRLRNSITHKVTRDGKDVIGTVGTDVEYAPFLEHGTVNIPPYPWLFPALEARKEEVKKALEE